ncbi:MAG: hypothetical protein HZC28_19020 [Spirochaetes bacterium]|nr:hypothetical protein [Spirochaetota bacterium]
MRHLYLIALAAGILSIASADDFTGARVSVSPAEKQISHGIVWQKENKESVYETVTRDGKTAIREKKMMYFAVTDERFKKGALPLLRIDIAYFDEGKGVIVMKYDSSDASINPGPNAGVWKGKKALTLTDTRTWTNASIFISDAYFAGRCNGGDFRFECKTPLIISAVTITAADDASQEKARMRTNNAAPAVEQFTLTYDEVVAKLAFYVGIAKENTAASTLTGSVMCGYQGWHGAPGDGSGRGWVHYQEHITFEPGDCHVDYWPDVRGFDADEKYATPFKHRDGSTAYVFSAMNRKTVDRHFAWMEDNGIDGAFVQRFASVVKNPATLYKNNTVLMNVRAAANARGRSYAVMYDLSGAKDTDILINDWKILVSKMGIGKDPNDKAYQRHNGRPVVALWGLFADREYSIATFERLVDFMKNDPVHGGFSIKLGVNNNWRTGTGANADRVRKIIAQGDIVSPWTVGRYSSIDQAELFYAFNNKPDQDWCRANGKDYMPVIFPGFSWYNMHDGATPLGAIPRLQGRFFWKQITLAKEAGASMLYVAMFDEIDEGTAIYKVDNDPPVCDGTVTKFLDYEGLPNDQYLWLSGMAKKLLANGIPPTALPPARKGVSISYKPLDANGLAPGLNEISVILEKQQISRGIIMQERGIETLNIPVTRNGRSGWMSKALGDKDGGRKVYLKIDYSEFRGKTVPPLTLEIDYFDDCAATVRVVYDSRDFSYNPGTANPGAWKEAGSFQTGTGGAWKTAAITVSDPLFAGRCNGNDIRLEFGAGADLVIGAVRLKK